MNELTVSMPIWATNNRNLSLWLPLILNTYISYPWCCLASYSISVFVIYVSMTLYRSQRSLEEDQYTTLDLSFKVNLLISTKNAVSSITSKKSLDHKAVIVYRVYTVKGWTEQSWCVPYCSSPHPDLSRLRIDSSLLVVLYRCIAEYVCVREMGPGAWWALTVARLMRCSAPVSRNNPTDYNKYYY